MSVWMRAAVAAGAAAAAVALVVGLVVAEPTTSMAAVDTSADATPTPSSSTSTPLAIGPVLTTDEPDCGDFTVAVVFREPSGTIESTAGTVDQLVDGGSWVLARHNCDGGPTVCEPDGPRNRLWGDRARRRTQQGEADCVAGLVVVGPMDSWETADRAKETLASVLADDLPAEAEVVVWKFGEQLPTAAPASSPPPAERTPANTPNEEGGD